MKYLALALLLCVLISLSDSQCIFKHRTPERENQTHCQDSVDLTWHPIGTKWRNSVCQVCTCDECCNGYSTPRKFPEDCVSVFDPKSCQYVVHKKDNPSVLCPVFAAVGK
ncbi:PREDICTED: beta-microseminoprotein [Poecilia mexicana]|uniref:beta-microseminoprotein n=1 Tax=Poecilia mexicana TaxID=48701 RepID=UPI00072E20EE|nr:PREDICTED: beta-microseminoprotein [Poecilia mexicana]